MVTPPSGASGAESYTSFSVYSIAKYQCAQRDPDNFELVSSVGHLMLLTSGGGGCTVMSNASWVMVRSRNTDLKGITRSEPSSVQY